MRYFVLGLLTLSFISTPCFARVGPGQLLPHAEAELRNIVDAGAQGARRRELEAVPDALTRTIDALDMDTDPVFARVARNGTVDYLSFMMGSGVGLYLDGETVCDKVDVLFHEHGDL